MKVSELIAVLNECNPELSVYCMLSNGRFEDAQCVIDVIQAESKYGDDAGVNGVYLTED